MTPSEIAELILPWAKSLNKETFTNSEAYHAIDCIESPSDVSDALRYMFEHGMVARKKKDGKSYLYALTNNAPDDFDMHEIKQAHKKKENNFLHQDEKITIEITDMPDGINNIHHIDKPIKIPYINDVKELIVNTPDETADIGNTDNYITGSPDKKNYDDPGYDVKPSASLLTSWMTKEQAIGYRAQSIIDFITKMNESHESELYYLKSAQKHLDELIKLIED